jgi:hypothetical protein
MFGGPGVQGLAFGGAVKFDGDIKQCAISCSSGPFTDGSGAHSERWCWHSVSRLRVARPDDYDVRGLLTAGGFASDIFHTTN